MVEDLPPAPPDNAEPSQPPPAKAENAANVYDQAIRHLMQSDPMGMIRWLVPGLSADTRWIDWHDSRNLPFPGFGDLICDLIADLSDRPKGPPTHALVLEFMARAKTTVIDRALLYVIEAYRRLRHGKDRKGRYQTHVAIINLTERNRPCVIESRPPRDPNAVPTQEGWIFKPTIRNIRDDDAAETLEGIENKSIPFGALPLVPLMKGGGKPDIIARWRKNVEQVTHEHWRPNLPPLAVLFAELRKRHHIWARALKGWDMLTSEWVRQWQDVGERKGEQKGEQKGRLEQAQEALLTVLKARFHDLGGNGLESQIAKQTDAAILSQWLVNASVSPSLAEFRKRTKL